MSQKKVSVEGIGPLILLRRKNNKNIRISISPSGVVKIGMPPLMPYAIAIGYAKHKAEWINKHRPAIPMIRNNTNVGKAHHIIFREGKSLRSSSVSNNITIWMPAGSLYTDDKVQKLANTAIVRMLKKESVQLLPPKLKYLAEKHGFEYKSVVIKKLSSRWGSCDSSKNITLNCYLLELPWNLIDYVLLHELVHTRIMAHGKKFWSELDKYVTDLPNARKSIKQYKPTLEM